MGKGSKIDCSYKKSAYWCFWYFKKRRGDSFSSEVAFILQMAYNKVFEFSAEVRGYHYYRRFWIPQKDWILECFFETHNPFDHFAIKVCKVANENAVGHLPREISRVTKFFMDRRVIVSTQLTSEHYRRLPIVQGGMEITCKVTVKIPGTCVNILLMEKYKQLVQQLYIEPKNEEIVGSFLQAKET